MSDNAPQDNASFRKEALDNAYNDKKKPFFISTPLNSGLYVLFSIAFLVFIAVASYLIKFPVHILAQGEVLNGKEYIQISVPDDTKAVSHILVAPGQHVQKGDVLSVLEMKNATNVADNLKALQISKRLIQTSIDDLDASHKIAAKQYELLKSHNLAKLEQAKREALLEKQILARYSASVENGLVAVKAEEEQKRITLAVDDKILAVKENLLNLEITATQANTLYEKETMELKSQLESLELQIMSLSQGTLVTSPCDCEVDNILVSPGDPVRRTQSLFTLSSFSDDQSVIIYVPSSTFRTIQTGMTLQLAMSAYPSTKYGYLKARVTKVSSSPVPVDMISDGGVDGLRGTVFVVHAQINNIPEQVEVVTGMAIRSNIVIGERSLIDMMFEE